MENTSDCAQIDAEEVRGSKTDACEQEAAPKYYEGNGERSSGVGGAVVELEVGDEAGLLVGTILFHKGTLVLGLFNQAALEKKGSE